MSGTPLMVTFHGYNISSDKTDYYRNSYKNIFQFSAILSVNPLYSYTLLKSINDNLKIAILSAELDTKKFNRINQKVQNRKLRITFVARLIRLKGAHLAIQIADLLRKEYDQEFELILIEGGPEYSRLKFLVSDLRLSNIIRLLGSLTQEEIRHQLSNSDIFLFPGIRDPDTGRCETQGLVVQEAQAMEIPVVIPDVGGVKYGVIDGVSGFVESEGDILKFVDVLKLWIFDPHLRSSMGSAGREYAVKEYDNQGVGRKLGALYDSIAKI